MAKQKNTGKAPEPKVEVASREWEVFEAKLVVLGYRLCMVDIGVKWYGI